MHLLHLEGRIITPLVALYNNAPGRNLTNINSKCYRIYYYSSNNKYDIIYYQIQLRDFGKWMAHFSWVFSQQLHVGEGTGRDSLESIFLLLLIDISNLW